jgi:hypothetical protein
MALTGGVHMTPHPPTHPPIQIVKKMLGEQFLRHTFEMTYVRCLTLALFQRFLKQNKCQTFLNIPQVLRNNNIALVKIARAASTLAGSVWLLSSIYPPRMLQAPATAASPTSAGSLPS